MRRRASEGRKEKNCMRLRNILINTHILLKLSSRLHLLRMLQCRICQRRNGRGEATTAAASPRRKIVKRVSESHQFLASVNTNI
jgi:hypothetical protein